MRFTDSSQEIPLVKNLTDLKKRDPYLKIIPSLGGWDDSAGDKYSRMVSNSISRANFVQNAVQFLNQYSFDGLGETLNTFAALFICLKLSFKDLKLN